ncbi:dipeptide/oligopeptide/nickel ABC transporter permease/ATP-binding protein (plasmid) [Embleya sp. NBC_00888]|uniref:dipeptide/oligopeptide/nickel ABC transporter permease/ATP-binding protein n=1 Tax=Embleya sp. NBC_00888 TaxID=2975960 RepID=UPI002F9112E4|nr:dipeptide/oligopeptide/nickel ABC transporter permease/ATP-binding protein [Embleya sp. NBC_00888]
MMRQELVARLTGPGIRLRRLRRLPLPARICSIALVLLCVVALLAPWIAPHDPLATGTPAQGPSGEHWFGTDRAGRDVFSRLLVGARWSLAIGLGATALALVLGGLIGALAATSRRFVDEGAMRVLDVVMAFPNVALAAVFVAVFGSSLTVLVCSIAFLYTPSLARVVRANVLAQYGEDYVAAERVIGARRPHILIRHVAVNCAAPILVFATVLVADAIVFEASLSFIGAGVPDPDPSWGSVIAYGRTLVLTGGWWATFFPGLLILLTVLALNVLAEGISDAWAAPSGPAGSDPVDAERRTARIEPLDPHARADLDARLAEAAAHRPARTIPDAEPLLSVRGLSVRFPDRHGGVRIVDGVDFDVRPGETVGLVGESGCGKSLTSLAVIGLLPKGAESGGEIRFAGHDLSTMSPRRRRPLLGHEIAMVYQDALSSLNPALTIRTQLTQLTRRGGTRTPAQLLELVGLDAARVLRSHPHQLSGGQRQRVLIAMALSRDPRLILADEPTTALDVTVQAQIVDLLVRLRDELGFALVLVSHDLALVSSLADRIVVMYGGHVVETGRTGELLRAPEHHYARGLLGSVLSLEAGEERLHQIPGVVPPPAEFGPGCRFADRCPAASDLCHDTRPALTGAVHEHAAACHHPATPLTGAAR